MLWHIVCYIHCAPLERGISMWVLSFYTPFAPLVLLGVWVRLFYTSIAPMGLWIAEFRRLLIDVVS